MKAIVTVVGKDRVGIIAGVCTALADFNVNVLDISQTVMQGYFTMMMRDGGLRVQCAAGRACHPHGRDRQGNGTVHPRAA